MKRSLIFGAIGMVLMAIVSMSVVWIMQARESARNHRSRLNLKQMGLALHQYSDVINAFPPGGTFAQDGTPHHSWSTLIRGFLKDPIYDRIDFNRPWNDVGDSGEGLLQSNREQFRAERPNFVSQPGVEPLLHPVGYPLIHYSGSDRVFYRNSRLRIRDFPRGLQNVLFIGESFGDFPPAAWPGNWRTLDLGLQSTSQSFGNPSKGATEFLMGNGGTRSLSVSIDPTVLRELADAHPDSDWESRRKPPVLPEE